MSSRRFFLRDGAIVHTTMNTATASAASISSRTHPIAWRKSFALAFAAAACAVAVGCAVTPPPRGQPRAAFVKASWSDLPGWRDDDPAAAWPAFEAGCAALVAKPATLPIWQRPCEAAARVDGRDGAAVRRFFEGHFSPYRVLSPEGGDTGLVTGYYEPLLAGSRLRSERFAVPLLGVPGDLVVVDLASLYPELRDKRVRGRLDGRRVVPYWTRAEIEAGKATHAQPLAFVAQPIDAFLLQVQGSGRIALDDGTTMRVGYADQNGHPYVAIGRVLVEHGELALGDVSLAAIKAWVLAHPRDAARLMDENPSFVFFRELTPPAPGSLEARIDGPRGALGVPLLARRTIAVDPRAIPLGAPVFVATRVPSSGQPIERLTLAQDTGGAIRGAVRADFFWGSGAEAEREAGTMREQGRLWLLWPEGDAPPAPRG